MMPKSAFLVEFQIFQRAIKKVCAVVNAVSNWILIFTANRLNLERKNYNQVQSQRDDEFWNFFFSFWKWDLEIKVFKLILILMTMKVFNPTFFLNSIFSWINSLQEKLWRFLELLKIISIFCNFANLFLPFLKGLQIFS